MPDTKCLSASEQRLTARTLRESGLSYQAIGAQVGVSKSTVIRWLDPVAAQRQRERQRVVMKNRYHTDSEFAAEQRTRQKSKYSVLNSTVDGRINTALNTSRRQAVLRGHKPCSASVKELLSTLNDKCDICGIPESECDTRLHLDHDHITGQFRGWLCAKCNKGIGLMNDDSNLLTTAASYLSRDTNRKVV